MNTSDLQAFTELWTVTRDFYDRPVREQSIEDAALMMAFRILSIAGIDEIQSAIDKHMRNPESGKWMPKPADLMQYITGTLPTANEIIGLARAANTPLGCFALMIIGKWDLDNQDSFYLNQRGEQVKAELPEFVKRARAGNYTNGEISLMKSKNINLASELSPGLPGPSKETVISIMDHARRIPAHVPTADMNSIDKKDDATAALALIHDEASTRTQH